MQPWTRRQVGVTPEFPDGAAWVVAGASPEGVCRFHGNMNIFGNACKNVGQPKAGPQCFWFSCLLLGKVCRMPVFFPASLQDSDPPPSLDLPEGFLLCLDSKA